MELVGFHPESKATARRLLHWSWGVTGLIAFLTLIFASFLNALMRGLRHQGTAQRNEEKPSQHRCAAAPFLGPANQPDCDEQHENDAGADGQTPFKIEHISPMEI